MNSQQLACLMSGCMPLALTLADGRELWIVFDDNRLSSEEQLNQLLLKFQNRRIPDFDFIAEDAEPNGSNNTSIFLKISVDRRSVDDSERAPALNLGRLIRQNRNKGPPLTIKPADAEASGLFLF